MKNGRQPEEKVYLQRHIEAKHGGSVIDGDFGEKPAAPKGKGKGKGGAPVRADAGERFFTDL